MDDAFEIVERRRDDTAIVAAHVKHDGIADFLGGAFGEVMAVTAATPIVGPPFARYRGCEDGFDIEAGFPVADPVEPSGRVTASTLPGGTAATVIHRGPYEGLGDTYAALEAWMGRNGWAPADAPWESYLDGPEVAEPRTLVSWPCRREGSAGKSDQADQAD